MIAIAAPFLFGCASKSLPPAQETMPPIVLANLGDAGIKDLRHLYRATVCAQLPEDSLPCEELILHFPGEASSPIPVSQRDISNRYRIGIVPGLFSDCFNRIFYPFTDVSEKLKEFGFAVHDFPVGGRASSAENAQRLANRLAELSPDPRPFIMIVHSKGLPDVLELLLRYPETSQHVAAIVSIAGASNGSPFADDLYEFYRDWLAGLPIPGCDRGTGEEVYDLRRDVRLEWWRQNQSAITVPIFSLAAVPRAYRVSPVLKQMHAKLSSIDPRNDGQLLWYDTVAPGGYLLGYINADHLAIAVPASQQMPALSFLFKDNVPRLAIVRGAIEVAAETLQNLP
ncbi:MAG TPA: hypothetical protein VEG60_26605 [Candidatus Binatia bacterium]|nr:hypothetical protein [Candidatus Binatia bacterium]